MTTVEQVNRLHYDIELMTRRLEQEKRHLQRVDHELEAARKRRLQRIHESGIRHRPRTPNGKESSSLIEGSLDTVSHRPGSAAACAASIRSTSENTSAKVQFQRLDQYKKKLDQIHCANEETRQEVNRLRNLRVQADRIFATLRKEIGKRLEHLSECASQNLQGEAVLEGVKQRVKMLKDQQDSERNNFKREVLKFRDQLSFYDWEKKEVTVRLKRLDEDAHLKRDLVRPEAEVNFNENALMRRILKTAFLNCIQRRHIKAHQRSIEVFEQAFSTIKQTTGMQHIEEIVNIFVNLESKNYSLMNYINHINRDIEVLEAGQRERGKLVERLQQTNTEYTRKRDEALNPLAHAVQAASEDAGKNKEIRMEYEIVFSELKAPVAKLGELLKEILQEDHPAVPLEVRSLAEWLDWVEVKLGKLRDVLPVPDKGFKETPFPFTAQNSVLQMGPRKQTVAIPLVKVQDMPSAPTFGAEDLPGGRAGAGHSVRKEAKAELLDEESDEEDFADRPLKVQELRLRAENAIHNRRKARSSGWPGTTNQSMATNWGTTSVISARSTVVDFHDVFPESPAVPSKAMTREKGEEMHVEFENDEEVGAGGELFGSRRTQDRLRSEEATEQKRAQCTPLEDLDDND